LCRWFNQTSTILTTGWIIVQINKVRIVIIYYLIVRVVNCYGVNYIVYVKVILMVKRIAMIVLSRSLNLEVEEQYDNEIILIDVELLKVIGKMNHILLDWIQKKNHFNQVILFIIWMRIQLKSYVVVLMWVYLWIKRIMIVVLSMLIDMIGLIFMIMN